MKSSRKWGLSFRGGHPKKEAPTAKVYPFFIFYKTSYKYFSLLPPRQGKTTQHSLRPSVREKVASQILNSYIEVASLCTFSSGQETGMGAAVRTTRLQPAAVFLLKAPREGFLSTLPRRTGSLVIMERP